MSSTGATQLYPEVMGDDEGIGITEEEYQESLTRAIFDQDKHKITVSFRRGDSGPSLVYMGYNKTDETIKIELLITTPPADLAIHTPPNTPLLKVIAFIEDIKEMSASHNSSPAK